MEETLRLYAEVREISNQGISLIIVRDQTHNALKLALTIDKKVAEIGVNLEHIPSLDLIHFHKKIGDILYTELLKTTLNISKLEDIKSNIETRLR